MFRTKPPNQNELLFDLFKDQNGNIVIGRFLRELHSCGIKRNDPRIKQFVESLQHLAAGGDIDPLVLDEKKFCKHIENYVDTVCQAFQNDYVIRDFSSFCQSIQEIYWNCKDNKSGVVADYIPQLKKMNPGKQRKDF